MSMIGVMRAAANLDGTDDSEKTLVREVEKLMKQTAAETWGHAVYGTEDKNNDPPPREMPDNVWGVILANVIVSD